MSLSPGGRGGPRGYRGGPRGYRGGRGGWDRIGEAARWRAVAGRLAPAS